MDAKLAVLADAANLTREGKLNILGEFNVIFAARVPTTWPLMFLVLKLETTPGEGALHRLRIRVIDQDGTVVAPEVLGDANFGERFLPGLPLTGVLIFEIRSAQFRTYGTYEFEVYVNDRVLTKVPLHVVSRQGPTKE
jgi:hypothetical protein